MYLVSHAILVCDSMQASTQTVHHSSYWKLLLLLLKIAWNSLIAEAHRGSPELWMLMSIKNLELCSSK